MHGDVNVVVTVRAQALTDESSLVGFADRCHEAAVHVDGFTAQVDEAMVAADCAQADCHALNEGMRVGEQGRDVLTGCPAPTRQR